MGIGETSSGASEHHLQVSGSVGKWVGFDGSLTWDQHICYLLMG